MRIAIVLNEHGEPALYAADEQITLLIVDPNCPKDQAYLHGGVYVGAKYVDEWISGRLIGHMHDGGPIKALSDVHE